MTFQLARIADKFAIIGLVIAVMLLLVRLFKVQDERNSAQKVTAHIEQMACQKREYQRLQRAQQKLAKAS